MSSNPTATPGIPAAPDQSLVGRKVYSPATIAVYTALANLPIGFILYGLNLRARGRRGRGITLVWIGVFGIVLLQAVALSGSLPGAALMVGLLGAINVYHLEQRPYEQAIRRGATKARWWPPALVILALTALLFGVQVFGP